MTSQNTVQLKIVIVGDGACGKSALLIAYTKKKYGAQYTPTVVDNYEVLLALNDDQNLKLTVVDTAGQEEFKNIRNLNFGGTHVFIVCYSCDSRASLDNVKSLWVPEIRDAAKGAPFVLVGNKTDILPDGHPSKVTKKEAARVCKQLDGYVAMQCSAKEFAQTQGLQGGVEDVFKAAIKRGLIEKGVLPQEPICCDTCTIV